MIESIPTYKLIIACIVTVITLAGGAVLFLKGLKENNQKLLKKQYMRSLQKRNNKNND